MAFVLVLISLGLLVSVLSLGLLVLVLGLGLGLVLVLCYLVMCSIVSSCLVLSLLLLSIERKSFVSHYDFELISPLYCSAALSCLILSCHDRVLAQWRKALQFHKRTEAAPSASAASNNQESKEVPKISR
jgi:hypothetical protein